MLKKLSTVWFVIAALLVAACGSVATPEWSEEAEGTRVAQAATAEQQTANAPTAAPTSTLTPTPQPTNPPTATNVPPTSAPATEPATIAPTAATAEATAAAQNTGDVPEGDPANGEVLFNEMQPAAGFACVTCHFPNQEAQLIGPGLLNVSTRAESRVPGTSAYDYIHTSIVDPSAFVVPGFPDNLMPKIYGEIFTEEQINDIIAFLFTLKS